MRTTTREVVSTPALFRQASLLFRLETLCETPTIPEIIVPLCSTVRLPTRAIPSFECVAVFRSHD